MRRVAALTCVLVLGCGAAVAGADAVVPTEGPWQATTSAGLPVSFEVGGGPGCTNFGTGSSGASAAPTPRTRARRSRSRRSGHWKRAEDPSGPLHRSDLHRARPRRRRRSSRPTGAARAARTRRRPFTAQPGTCALRGSPRVVVLASRSGSHRHVQRQTEDDGAQARRLAPASNTSTGATGATKKSPTPPGAPTCAAAAAAAPTES